MRFGAKILYPPRCSRLACSRYRWIKTRFIGFRGTVISDRPDPSEFNSRALHFACIPLDRAGERHDRIAGISIGCLALLPANVSASFYRRLPRNVQFAWPILARPLKRRSIEEVSETAKLIDEWCWNRSCDLLLLLAKTCATPGISGRLFQALDASVKQQRSPRDLPS